MPGPNDPNDVQSKVVNILSAAKPAARKQPTKTPRAQAQKGSNNVQVGGDLTINHHAPARIIVKAEPRPGIEHITEEQAATLKRLVDAVVDLEKVAKRAPRSHGAVWSALNRSLHVGSYRMIRLADFPQAEKRLRTDIGRLNRSSGAAKAPGHRKGRIADIQARCNKLGMQERRKLLMRERFGLDSMTEMSDPQIEQLYSTVMAWR